MSSRVFLYNTEGDSLGSCLADTAPRVGEKIVIRDNAGVCEYVVVEVSHYIRPGKYPGELYLNGIDVVLDAGHAKREML